MPTAPARTRRAARLAALGACGLVLLLAGCAPSAGPEPAADTLRAEPAPAPAPAAPPIPPLRVLATETGSATFISSSLEGRPTATGEAYDGRALVAAHPAHPLGTRVRVTNEANGRSVELHIIDRSGPAERTGGSVIDLSAAAAAPLGVREDGRVRVRVDVLAWGGAPQVP